MQLPPISRRSKPGSNISKRRKTKKKKGGKRQKTLCAAIRTSYRRNLHACATTFQKREGAGQNPHAGKGTVRGFRSSPKGRHWTQNSAPELREGGKSQRKRDTKYKKGGGTTSSKAFKIPWAMSIQKKKGTKQPESTIQRLA